MGISQKGDFMIKNFNEYLKYAKIKKTNINVLNELCSITNQNIEFGNGGNEILIIPPNAE